jgi:tetratricopeptide (TPR) repeat protein
MLGIPCHRRRGAGYLVPQMRAFLRPVAVWGGLCVLVATLAQDVSLVPGLRKTLAAATNDTLRADALARICFNLIRSDPDSAQHVGDQAMVLAKRIGNRRAIADAHNNLGWLAAEQGELERADSLLRIALGIFQRIGVPEYTSVTLSNLGWVAEKKGDSVASLKRFHEALALSERAQDTATISIVLYSIGITYRKVGERERALEYLQRSLEMERALGRRNTEANCLIGIANTHREMGDTAKAIATLNAASRIYVDLSDHVGLGLAHENLGEIESERDPQRALRHYAVALAHYDSVDSRIDKAYVLLRLGAAQLKGKDLPAAASHLLTGAELAGVLGDRHLTMSYELALAELCSEQNDGKGAFRHYARYVALKDSLQGADTQHELARLRTAFDSERKEKDNAILRAENSEQQERLKRRDLQLYGSVALAALALIAALLFWRNYRQKRKHADVLEELNTQLAESNTEITEINGLLEMKLLRSQMNPHFIYNCLNSAARMTQAGQNLEALAYLQGFARLLRMVLDHSVNDTVSITEEVAFLRQYLKLEGVRLEGLHYEVDAEPALLDDEVMLPALIVQPFVENAVWHGLADRDGEKRITVRFARNGNGIRCTITDNGIGRAHAEQALERDPSHRSLGMQLTSERLRLLARRMSEAGAITVEDLRNSDGSAAGTSVVVRMAEVGRSFRSLTTTLTGTSSANRSGYRSPEE